MTVFRYLIALILLLCGSCSSLPSTYGNDNDRQVVVRLSDTTLSFSQPALHPSKDFPPPRVVTGIDLRQISKSTTIFHGYWDGPRHQLLSTIGTLRIWLHVQPWPVEFENARGCTAKASAYADQVFALEMAKHVKSKEGIYASPPETKKTSVVIAGRESVGYWLSYDFNAITYVIPIDDRYFLRLMFHSVDNSNSPTDWGKISMREQENFLRSLKLSGATNCEFTDVWPNNSFKPKPLRGSA